MITTPIIIFAVSLLGMIVMIIFRTLDIERKQESWISLILNKTDHFVFGIFKKIESWVSYINKHTAIALVQWIAYHILSVIRRLYLWIHGKAHAHPHSKKVIDMVRGKGEIKESGGASFYLKKIGDEGVGKKDVLKPDIK